MKLLWTPLAGHHLEAAHDYLAQNGPTAAEDMIERIVSAVQVLKQHPQMGRKGRVRGTRELVIAGTPFVVAYRLRPDQIEILAVMHGARRWPDRL